MAAHERPVAKISIASPTSNPAPTLTPTPTPTSTPTPTLLERLATVLPNDTNFNIYHLSTPPTRTSAIYSAPPNTRPDRTYCENHFLAASISTSAKDHGAESKEVLVYAIEVLIYSTAYDSTFFVSKADSTGYMHHLALQKGTPSPLRNISATFLQHLVEQHQRPNIRCVISLFARAQDQYLFPGSVEYGGKHVLDDRGLVRWWCRVLDPLIDEAKASVSSKWAQVKGYLTIPGLDSHETLSYIPKGNPRNLSWTIGHPLQEISRHANDVPPRCLIPHYPDDPKARYLDELDDEITKGSDAGSGQWKSVRNIDQFWDMMAFRQECSAGRMVGFIWIVFTPKIQHEPAHAVKSDTQSTFMSNDSQPWDDTSFLGVPDGSSLPVTPATSFNASSQARPLSSPLKANDDFNEPPASQQSVQSAKPRPSKRKKLTGPINPREPRIKTENSSIKSEILLRPESTPYYLWKPEGRGQVIVDESGYKRVTELLLRLDFANLELATSSSRRWINEVRSSALGSMAEAWGHNVVGTKAVERVHVAGAAGVNSLNMGLVRKKRKAAPDESNISPPAKNDTIPAVNVLGASMIRKKAKS
ncbi:Histone acetyltransferase [Lachnellula occidentalis]|uniref:histone acetyltransferase n=1 Tax=Lachnellula occidentalis TaxID=215460 RepID=A0A8H8RUR2_9HELO|nr:Histone acetyltransferase [Lachnellula occidentalis]